MAWMIVWLVIALGGAAVVLLFASVAARAESEQGEEQGLASFWRDFRAGLRPRRRARIVPGEVIATVRKPKPVDTSMDDFFAATEVSTPAYVDAEELTDVLHRARERAARPLHLHGERNRP